MSWFSDTVLRDVERSMDQLQKPADNLARQVGVSAGGRRGLKKGGKTMMWSTVPGTMGLQYDYSRQKGMNEEEASTNALGHGMTYTQSRAAETERVVKEDARVAAADFEKKRVAEETRARGQVAVRVRRGMRDRPSTKSGTVLTGGLGTTGTSAGTFAALLGL